MGNDIVPYNDGYGHTRKGKKEIARQRDRAVIRHQSEAARQNSDFELMHQRVHQTYTAVDSAMSRSASSHRLMRELTGDDHELDMALGLIKGRADQGVAYRIGNFAAGGNW